ELVKRDVDVLLVDRDEPGLGCSFGNSGAISPGSIAPLAMPGILASLPHMLFAADSPLRIPIDYVPRLLPWLLRFLASAKPKRIESAAQTLNALNSDAVVLHQKLAAEVGVPELLVKRGHLHLYPDAAALKDDEPAWRLREHFSIPFERLNRAGILSLEPNIG